MANVDHSAKQKYLRAHAAVLKRFKRPSATARKSQAAAMVVYRQRAKNGLQPLKKPWDFLTSQEVKKMAWLAYRVAAFELRDSMVDPDWQVSHQEKRERFAELLAETFKSALDAHSVTEGGCWPVDSSTPPYRNYPRIWQMLARDVPAEWRPERPVYADVGSVQ